VPSDLGECQEGVDCTLPGDDASNGNPDGGTEGGPGGDGSLPDGGSSGNVGQSTLAVGFSHACFLFTTGGVKCWGGGGDGQLGQGSQLPIGAAPNQMGANLAYVNLGANRKVTQVAAGENRSCAVFDNGQVKCWGNNAYGALGLGDIVNRGDTATGMGDNLPTVDLGAGLKVAEMAMGESHACARFTDGRVKCWGSNVSGSLGIGAAADRGGSPGDMGDNLPFVQLGTGRKAVELVACFSHACARLDNGSVKCWGINDNGQLGIGDTIARGGSASDMGDNLPAVNLGAGRTARQIYCGHRSTCAVLDDGTVKCWGLNASGQLGQGDMSDRGALPSDMGDNLLPIRLGTGRTVKRIVSGVSHKCAILDDGTTKCWGANDSGQLGIGSTSTMGTSSFQMGDALLAIDFGTGRRAVSLSLGLHHSCALLDNGAVKCWGYGPDGELGNGSAATRGDNPGEMGDALPIADLTP
jgi:alpha-tubulin suppressor-like RCC1 family protein